MKAPDPKAVAEAERQHRDHNCDEDELYTLARAWMWINDPTPLVDCTDEVKQLIEGTCFEFIGKTLCRVLLSTQHRTPLDPQPRTLGDVRWLIWREGEK